MAVSSTLTSILMRVILIIAFILAVLRELPHQASASFKKCCDRALKKNDKTKTTVGSSLTNILQSVILTIAFVLAVLRDLPHQARTSFKKCWKAHRKDKKNGGQAKTDKPILPTTAEQFYITELSVNLGSQNPLYSHSNTDIHLQYPTHPPPVYQPPGNSSTHRNITTTSSIRGAAAPPGNPTTHNMGGDQNNNDPDEESGIFSSSFHSSDTMTTSHLGRLSHDLQDLTYLNVLIRRGEEEEFEENENEASDAEMGFGYVELSDVEPFPLWSDKAANEEEHLSTV